MDYISTREAACKWNVSLRYVQRLLADSRIPQARKYGVSWLIPADAEKPDDLRKARRQPDKKAQAWILLPPTAFSKRSHNAAANAPAHNHALLDADTTYRRGDPKPAMNLWNSTPDSDPVKLTAAAIATPAAISAGDFDLYCEIQRAVQSRIERSYDKRERALLSLPSTLAAVSMKAVSMTPEWLREGDFSLFPKEHIPLLLYMYTLHLRNVGDAKAVLCTAKTSYTLCAQTNTFTWLDVYNLILCAQAYLDMGDKERAKEYLFAAMKLGLPAGFIAPFADYLGTMGGLTEICLDALFPQYKAPITALWSHSFGNWMAFHNRFTCENITTILSPQEYQLARCISRGASYAEAARQMNLSVGRIKNVLTDIYGKLYISSRRQLTRFIT